MLRNNELYNLFVYISFSFSFKLVCYLDILSFILFNVFVCLFVCLLISSFSCYFLGEEGGLMF